MYLVNKQLWLAKGSHPSSSISLPFTGGVAKLLWLNAPVHMKTFLLYLTDGHIHASIRHNNRLHFLILALLLPSLIGVESLLSLLLLEFW